MTDAVSRREFMTRGGGALLGGAALLGAVAAGHAVGAQAAPATVNGPAAAAGTLLIGGDLRVSRLGFGAMRLTGDEQWGPPPDMNEARNVLRRAVELGINFIDTADAYGPFVDEDLIAATLYPYPRGLLITTKGGLTRPNKMDWDHDGRPEHLREACHASLQRLKLERIDLYQFHEPDPKVPFEDSIGELAKLQKEGKIRHIGVSNVDAQQLAKARAMVKVASVQNRYNVADRSSDAVLSICEREKIAFIPWGPLAQSAQAKGAADPHVAALSAVAKERGIDVNQAALAWLLARSPMMLPIPGTSRVAHLEDNVGAARIQLTAAEMARVG